jgi:hypothetical protein
MVSPAWGWDRSVHLFEQTEPPGLGGRATSELGIIPVYEGMARTVGGFLA